MREKEGQGCEASGGGEMRGVFEGREGGDESFFSKDCFSYQCRRRVSWVTVAAEGWVFNEIFPLVVANDIASLFESR